MSKGEGTKNKVVCVTLNTAIDHIIDVDTLDAGSTIRASHSQLVPAGKGVDVAVGVAAFGGHAVATGFIGENSREVFASLPSARLAQGVSTRALLRLVESGGQGTICPRARAAGQSCAAARAGDTQSAAAMSLLQKADVLDRTPAASATLTPMSLPATQRRLITRHHELRRRREWSGVVRSGPIGQKHRRLNLPEPARVAELKLPGAQTSFRLRSWGKIRGAASGVDARNAKSKRQGRW